MFVYMNICSRMICIIITCLRRQLYSIRSRDCISCIATWSEPRERERERLDNRWEDAGGTRKGGGVGVGGDVPRVFIFLF